MKHDPLTIHFLTRPIHRLRQQETILHCPECFRVRVSGSVHTNGVEQKINLKRRSLLRRIKRFLAYFVLPINVQWAGRVKGDTDVLYCWGSFPLSYRPVPYIVELDNPYVLSYYNIKRFRFLKSFIKNRLSAKRCRQIVCISNACRETLVQELGEELRSKTTVLYPYVQPLHTRTSTSNTPPLFLFIANDFFLKGGRELLFVFKTINAAGIQARLRMVTNLPEMFSEFSSAAWLEIITPGLEKNELFTTHFANADVFIHPTYQDSFGMVVLEALAYGLPIIATDVYAIREITGNTQILIPPPITYFDSSYCAVAEYWNPHFENMIQASRFPDFEAQLERCIRECLEVEKRKTLRQAALSVYAHVFRPEIREEAFIALIKRACNDQTS